MSHTTTPQFEGVWEVKRIISIPSLIHEDDAGMLIGLLEQLDGVKQVVPDITHRRLKVRYDASKANYHQLAMILEAQGFPPSRSWWSRLKGNWYQFTDSNARENANLPPPSCCNKPPK